eukprot:2964060-Rhodomonas_salina.1
MSGWQDGMVWCCRGLLQRRGAEHAKEHHDPRWKRARAEDGAKEKGEGKRGEGWEEREAGWKGEGGRVT